MPSGFCTATVMGVMAIWSLQVRRILVAPQKGIRGASVRDVPAGILETLSIFLCINSGCEALIRLAVRFSKERHFHRGL